MINEENLNKIYENISDKLSLTAKDLLDYGFNYSDIKILVTYNQLERISRGVYVIKSLNPLLDYGIELLDNKQYEKAISLFEKCHKIYPKNEKILLHLLYSYMLSSNYNKVFEIIDCFRTDNEKYSKDINLYLYILNCYLNVPLKYKSYIRSINYNDIMRKKSEDMEELKIVNKIKKEIYRRNTHTAIDLLNDYVSKKDIYPIGDRILNFLLVQAREVEKSHELMLFSFALNHQYDEIENYLSNMFERQNLNTYEKNILKVTKQIKRVLDSSIIPKEGNDLVSNVYDAIDQKQYQKALEFAYEYFKISDETSKNDAIYLLLRDICKLINHLESGNNIDEEYLKSLNINYKSKKDLQSYDEEYFIDSLHEKLVKQKGIILLDCMDEVTINRLLFIIQTYFDIAPLVIENDDKKRIMLRYKLKTNDHIDITKSIQMGVNYYHQRKYQNCIQALSKLIQYYDRPTEIVYGTIGLAYFRLGKNKIALKYLEVAKYLAKSAKWKQYYNEMIDKLNGDFSPALVKYDVPVNEEEFNCKESNCNIVNFEEINAFISINKVDIETAGQHFKLSLEQIDLLKLMYARNFYYQGDLQNGDKFLIAVQKSKNKTKKVQDELKYLSLNKKFLKNDPNMQEKVLFLNYIPKIKK